MEQARESARGAAVAMLGSLNRALGDLDRVTAWLMVYGMVNADPGYPETTNVGPEKRWFSARPTARARSQQRRQLAASPLDAFAIPAWLGYP